MKKILIIHSDMELGGAETSLLGLLYSLDYSRVSVDLFLYQQGGELLPMLPPQVHLLPEDPRYKALVSPIEEAIRKGHLCIATARVWAKVVTRIRNRRSHFTDYGYVLKSRAHAYATRFLPSLQGTYDLAISFNDPHWILARKTDAPEKLGWFHTDFSKITPDESMEERSWAGCTRIVTVSEACKDAFDRGHPTLLDRSIVIENILAKPFIEKQVAAFSPEEEMPEDGCIRLLSVGRFCEAKNFDNVPDITKRLLAMGLNVKWYLIGYGGDEALIRQKIAEAGMAGRVIILGKKENPYPYIAACDLYVQPSRYEGKCVTVREAQLLEKPVVIARYQTSACQLQDGVDGAIVPQDNQGCAEGIAALLRDPEKMQQLSRTCATMDHTNAAEVEKIYRLIGYTERNDIADGMKK